MRVVYVGGGGVSKAWDFRSHAHALGSKKPEKGIISYLSLHRYLSICETLDLIVLMLRILML